jgi:hypothetical protein
MIAANPVQSFFVAIEAPFLLGLANMSSGIIIPGSATQGPACAPLITRALRDKRLGQAQSFFAGRFIAKHSPSRYPYAKAGRIRAR